MNETPPPFSFLDQVEWHLEAWRKGKSFAEIAAAHRLVYQVEQVFLVHRATGRWLLSVATDARVSRDAAGRAQILKEVEEFSRDPFFAERQGGLDELHVNDQRVWLAFGPHAYLAVIIRGDPPEELKMEVEAAIQQLHAKYASALATFVDNTAFFTRAAPILTACLRGEHRSAPALPDIPWPRLRLPRMKMPRVALPRLRRVRPFVLALLALALLAAFFAVERERHWRQFIARLKAEPGILLGDAHHHWIRASQVAGLRDPLARDPAMLARETKVNPGQVRFDWKEYAAADAAIVERRFTARFGAAPEATVKVEGGTLQISGRVPNEWWQRVRREAKEVPGVQSFVARDVKVLHDPARVLEQFVAQFPLPPTVRASVKDNILILVGRAPYEWLAPVREGARKIPGLAAINGDDLVVEFNPELVVARFRDQFGIPEGANATVKNGSLVLTGEAPHAWLDQVRRGAMRVTGIRLLDDRSVEDIDQREFQATKTRLDGASVLFVLNRDSMSSEALGGIADDARRCLAAARNMGVNAALELRGYGDAVATDEANSGLSLRRAEAVREALIAAGIDEKKLDAAGLGTPPPPGPFERAGAGQFDRRVFFKVVIQP